MQYVEGSKEELADVVLDLLVNGLHNKSDPLLLCMACIFSSLMLG
jgi:hypothetical protein